MQLVGEGYYEGIGALILHLGNEEKTFVGRDL
jgi:hypothetical protein